MTRTALTALFAVMAMACTASAPAPGVAGAEQGTKADMVAALLAGAEADIDAGKTTAVARRLARLEALGAHAAADSESDPVAVWRAAVGNGEAVPFRGRALGPAYRRGTLAAEGELELTQTFLSGKKAVIAVSSPAGSAPALRVVSASGTTVCESAARCHWTPVFTERYTIVLRNTARKARAYYLVVE